MGKATLVIAPCAPGQRKACDLVREALARLCEGREDLQVAEADSPLLDPEWPILALDSSRECRATEILKSRRIKPLATLYVPDLIAGKQLLDPKQSIDAQWKPLLEGLTAALQEEAEKLLGLRREEIEYFEEMLGVTQRYLKEAAVLEAAGPPSAQKPQVPEEAKERLGLAANRFRNMFMRCDQILPPAALSTLHDVFQDACMCMTYAIQHWERGDWEKAEDYLEQAGHQAGPLLRHKGLKAAAQEDESKKAK